MHFILQHRSPITGVWEEKHFKNPPSATKDHNTHLFTLMNQTDNTFEIQIDDERKASGSLNEDMDPPVNAPKELDDPDDLVKPSNWIDDKKIDDPASSKPEDWDEPQPRMITGETRKCEDQFGEFYHNSTTGQSLDSPPPELAEIMQRVQGVSHAAPVHQAQAAPVYQSTVAQCHRFWKKLLR